ncbi:MAG: hypothetical protein E3J21_17780 [Anaerolineales bacterium]|nr:MAG: hypothetical protein E3J21_17780 [Anaerolineales bacterium]
MGSQQSAHDQPAEEEGQGQREVVDGQVEELLPLPGDAVRVEGDIVDGQVAAYDAEGKEDRQQGVGAGRSPSPLLSFRERGGARGGVRATGQ